MEELRSGFTVAYGPDLHSMGRMFLASRTRQPLGRESPLAEGAALRDRSISKLHASLTVSPSGAAAIRDEGSRHGTYVNGVAISRDEDTPLQCGDVVRMGDTLLVWRTDLPPSLGREPDDAVSEAICGVSVLTRALREQCRRAAKANYSVIVCGERGTGKSLVGSTIHRASGKRGQFLQVNCTALAEGVALSELFGHEAGAFTGAAKRRTGLVALDAESTLLLDEFAEMPKALQPILLQLLQERVYRPVGANDSIQFDARVIAATNIDVEQAMAAGTLRRDLFDRLHTTTLRVAPLHRRRADIPVLLLRFLQELGSTKRRVSTSLMHELMLAPWPDNTRGLQAVARLLAAQPGEEFEWSKEICDRVSQESQVLHDTKQRARPFTTTNRERPAPDELIAAMRAANGNVSAAARRLGKRRSSVYRWLNEADINPESFRGDSQPNPMRGAEDARP